MAARFGFMAAVRRFATAALTAAGVVVVFLFVLRAEAWTDGRPQDRLHPPDGGAVPKASKQQLLAACPDYKLYSQRAHRPFSDGEMGLPFQRPSPRCRTFESKEVEKVISEMTARMTDKDLARIFENAFPNTLDTTVRWHTDGTQMKSSEYPRRFEGPQSFIVTGDINAEWLRDSTNQLAQYLPLTRKDPALQNLVLGAINTQAEFVAESPYCNAFQPPPPSRVPPSGDGQLDRVHPAYEPSFVFECKYELDSLAHFLKLCNDFYAQTGNAKFMTERWYSALLAVLRTIDEQSQPTYDPRTGRHIPNIYRFERHTDRGSETLANAGIGNPIAHGTGMVRSAFRPSDDACILGFFIPANAMMAVELERIVQVLRTVGGNAEFADEAEMRASWIRQGIWEHGVVQHKKYGDVFAYEVDGYGSHIFMDDANIPSLLALPLLGFVGVNDKVYQNTRKMILERMSNPYFLEGPDFHGIGGPHIGFKHAWPMSLLVQAMTSADDKEIMDAINWVKNVSKLGLVHESVSVEDSKDYTRSWFAWANSVFAQTILDVAYRKPHLIFGDSTPYVLDEKRATSSIWEEKTSDTNWHVAWPPS